MMGNYKNLATTQALATLQPYFWILLGVIQIILATMLLSALFLKRARGQVFNSALYLAVLSLLGSILYSAYAGFPGIMWAIIPALLYVFVAYQTKYQPTN